jgi:hypothetical protein
MLAIDGDENFSQTPLQTISVRSWNGAQKVQLRLRGRVIATLTANRSSVTLPQPVWLHQLDFAVEGSQTSELPTLTTSQTCSDEKPPAAPGRSFPLSIQEANTLLVNANSLLSVSSLIPEGAQETMTSLSLRIDDSQATSNGPSWLYLEARGSGPLLSIPVTSEGDNDWSFDVISEDFSVKGTLSINSAGDFAVEIGEGTVGMLQLDKTSMILSGD